jgi:hypothetical protein
VDFARRRRIRPVAIDPATGRRISPWPFVGLCLVISSLFLYGASGLLAPAWAVVALLATWVVMFVLCFVWWSRPWRVMALGALAFAWWFVAITAGGILLGWNA